MGRRMKRQGLLLASLVLTAGAVTGPAQLNAEPYFMVPIEQEELPGRCNSEVYAEAIYWAPNPLEFHYAEVGNIDPQPNLFQSGAVTENLTSELLDPGWDWGFRFGYRMNRGKWFAQTDFVWIEMENSANATRGANNTMSIPNLNGSAAQITGFNVARADSNTQYENASLRVGYRGCDTCRGFFETFAVAEAFYFRFRARVRGVGESAAGGNAVPIYGIFTQAFEQLGLGLGSGLRLWGNVGRGFRVGGGFEAFGSVSRVNGIFEANSLTPLGNQAAQAYTDQRVPTLVTAHNCFALGFKGRMGVEYESCCFGCINFTGRLAYEMHVVKIGLVGGPIVGLGVNF